MWRVASREQCHNVHIFWWRHARRSLSTRTRSRFTCSETSLLFGKSLDLYFRSFTIVSFTIYLYWIKGILRGYAIRSVRRPSESQRPLTSLGTSAWPYRVTTQYSYCILLNRCRILYQRYAHVVSVPNGDPFITCYYFFKFNPKYMINARFIMFNTHVTFWRYLAI